MKTIGEIVKDREVYFVRVGQSVLEVGRYMASRNIGAVVVLEGDRLVGIFSERDLLKRVLVAGLDAASTPVEQVMTRGLATVEPGASYEDAMRRMNQVGVRHLPVVKNSRFLGLVSLRDLLLIDRDEKDHELKLMTAYIHFVPPQP